ncbi:MAG: restriction endonuclease [Treponema sp.]|nr:restriction endonuclease [Treponema sp.]
MLSINEENEKCITQCKFHEDNSKTVSSRETDEIIIALTKFGCKNGIFCTNSNLSPQSKREYEDNYPNYNVSWFDGEKIYDALMGNLILEKIWLEQIPIKDAVNITILPIFITPVINIEKDIDFTIDGKINIKISNGNNFYIETQFAPFNSNNVAKSLLNQTIPCLKAFVYGKIYIDQLESIKKSILAKLNEVTFFKNGFFYSIRFGIPHLSFSETEQTILNMPISPETYVYHNNNFLPEKDWFLKLDDNWNLPYYIKCGNADKLCYYNKKFDICLFVYYKSSFQKNFLIELQRNITNAIWQHSFFIIVNNRNYKAFLKKNDISTDIILPYGDTQTMLGWRVPASSFHGILEASELCFDADPYYDALVAKIKIIFSKNYKEISYDKAIKIAELNGYDVLNTKKELVLNLSDIIDLDKRLPSPITPENRFIKYKVVWIVNGDPHVLFQFLKI